MNPPRRQSLIWTALTGRTTAEIAAEVALPLHTVRSDLETLRRRGDAHTRRVVGRVEWRRNV